MKPITDTIRRARNTFLTPRVRAVLLAFNKYRSYTTGIPPRIQWDDEFVPPHLYPQPVPQAPREVHDGQGEGKGKGRAVDNGKGKERAAGERPASKAVPAATTSTINPIHPSIAVTKLRAPKKRKNISSETVDDSDDREDVAAPSAPGGSSGSKKRKVSAPKDDSRPEGHPTRPPAGGRLLPSIKSSRRKKPTTIPVSDLLPPPPCSRCVSRNQQCRPTGWKFACQACSKARQGCEHSKASPPPESIPAAVASSSKPAQKVKIVIPRTMYAKGSGPRRAVIVPVNPDVPRPNEKASGSSSTPGHPAGPSGLALSPPVPSGLRRGTPAGPAELESKSFCLRITIYKGQYVTDVILVVNSITAPATTAPATHPDLKTLWERIQDQDHRMREIEASDIALRSVMVTQDQLRKKDQEIRGIMDTRAEELHHQSRRIERKLDSYTEGDAKGILGRLVDLADEMAEIGETLEGQDRHMQEELQGAERRWERHVDQQERRLEARIEETEIRLHGKQMETADRVDTLSKRVDEAISKIAEETEKAPWERRVQEASVGWRKELEDAMVARPTREELSAYTTLLTTEKIIAQLANLQLATNEQLKGLQGGLNCMERLYLRQLDQSAEMVSVSNVRQFIYSILPGQCPREIAASSDVTASSG